MTDEMQDLLDKYKIKTVGLGWYDAETWKRLAAIPEARIEKSYQDFVSSFENCVRRNAAQGIKTEVMPIDLDHMIAWCHRNGYEIDTAGRSVYGNVMQMARDDPAVLDNPVVDTITRTIQ
jgi:hypothetical protein